MDFFFFFEKNRSSLKTRSFYHWSSPVPDILWHLTLNWPRIIITDWNSPIWLLIDRLLPRPQILIYFFVILFYFTWAFSIYFCVKILFQVFIYVRPYFPQREKDMMMMMMMMIWWWWWFICHWVILEETGQCKCRTFQSSDSISLLLAILSESSDPPNENDL